MIFWKFLMWCFGVAGAVCAWVMMGYLGIVSLFNPEYVDKYLEKVRQDWEND